MRSSRVPQNVGREVDSPADQVTERARKVLTEQVPVLLVVARGLCRDSTKAEDLVQDVLEKALRSINTLDLEKNPRGWMVAILHNLHIDRCRQLARLEPHVPYDDVPLSTPELLDAPMWSAPSVFDSPASHMLQQSEWPLWD